MSLLISFLENYLEIIGILAGICTVLSFLPQVIKIYRLRSAEAISLPMYVIFCIGEVLWIFYGILLKAPAVIMTNVMILLLSSIILVMKIMWS
jgi:MtN3 and saliva related transmembrane protein